MPIINTQIKGGGVQPTGTTYITTNGTHNVSSYEYADVQVPSAAPAAYIPRALTTSGNDVIYGMQGITESTVSTTTATIVDKYAFAYAFYNNTETSMQLPSISLPNVVEVKDYAFYYAFNQTTQHTGGTTPVFSAPSLTTVGQYAFNYAFSQNSPFISFDFSSVTSVAEYAFNNAFSKQTTSINFSGLTTLANYAFSNACRSAFDLATFNFSGLTSINGATYAFNNCLSWTSSEYTHTRDLDISFPALTTINNAQSCFYNFAQYNKNLHSFSFPELTSITNSSSVFSNAIQGSYYNNSSKQAAVSFPKLTEIRGSSSAFSSFSGYSNYNVTSDGVDFSKLEIIYASPSCFSNAFYRVAGLADANGIINMFPKLRMVATTGNYDQGPFNRTFSTMSIDVNGATFPDLEIISGKGQSTSYCIFSETFYGSNYLTKIEFPKLKVISRGIYQICGGSGFTKLVFGENIYSMGTYALVSLFGYTRSGVDFTIPVETISNDQAIMALKLANSHIRFPVLASVYQSGISQMLAGDTGNTLHFPIRMQSAVTALTGYPNFAGTSTTVLFDIVYKVNNGTDDYVRFHDGYNTTSYMYQHDYIVGADGVTYYRKPAPSGSYGTTSGLVRTEWVDENNNLVSTTTFEPTAGDTVYTSTGSQVKTTVTSYVPNRVYVPNTAEPQVGDTLYSDAACTISAGTISTIE